MCKYAHDSRKMRAYAAFMVDWDNLRIFLEAVRAGNYSAAAKRLHIDRTTVGRRLARLEHSLGTSLFEQGEDGYHPTRAGRRALETANEINDLVGRLSREVGVQENAGRSKIRVAISSDLGNELTDCLAAFVETEKDIDIALYLAPDAAEHVVRRKSDIGICLSDRQPDHLRSRRIGNLKQAGYASKAYVKKRGFGLLPQEYDWVRYSGWSQVPALRRWDDIFCDHIRVATQVDSWPALRAAVRSGMGAAFMWTFAANADDDLVQIAPVDESLSVDIWVVARDDMPMDTNTRALYDLLEDSIKRRVSDS